MQQLSLDAHLHRAWICTLLSSCTPRLMLDADDAHALPAPALRLLLFAVPQAAETYQALVWSGQNIERNILWVVAHFILVWLPWI
jgi:hypothetical protein